MYMKHESDGSIIFKPWNELRYLFGLNYPIIIISNATVSTIEADTGVMAYAIAAGFCIKKNIYSKGCKESNASLKIMF